MRTTVEVLDEMEKYLKTWIDDYYKEARGSAKSLMHTGAIIALQNALLLVERERALILKEVCEELIPQALKAGGSFGETRGTSFRP